ncbi:MAG: glutamine--tRNA ligase, partial [Lachnospiraceae bacterium]
DENGNIVEVHGTYDPASKGGNSPDGRKVKGTIHWVAAKTAFHTEVRLYENLVDEEKGKLNEDGTLNFNPNSLTVLKDCVLEPSLKDAKAYDSFQSAQWLFRVDSRFRGRKAVFNRIVSLKSL